MDRKKFVETLIRATLEKIEEKHLEEDIADLERLKAEYRELTGKDYIEEAK